MKAMDYNQELHFHLRSYQYLDQQGQPVSALPPSADDLDALAAGLQTMLLVRRFDKRAIDLQRTGQMGTYASCYGQEAIGTAIGELLQEADVLLPSYRETPALLMRGARMADILTYWGGDEAGSDWRRCRQDFPICIPIATQVTHACGVGFALKYRQHQNIALCVLGDGGTSKGDFYEGLNLAGAWQLPVLFLVVNNQWAISVPRDAQSAAPTLAQKAVAGGIDSEVVDGNDLVAMRERLALALERVRRGEPYLLEAATYRLGDHTTADDASRYRTAAELERCLAADPIPRLRQFLLSRGAWTDTQERDWLDKCDDDIEQAVADYQAGDSGDPGVIFDYLFQNLPAALQRQRQQVREQGGGCG